jgi:uncharacterized membrane protein
VTSATLSIVSHFACSQGYVYTFKDMGCLQLFPIVFILIPILLLLIVFEATTISFEKLGLSQDTAIALLILSMLGSFVNIPLARRKITVRERFRRPFPLSLFYYNPPRLAHQIIAINMGGAIVPIGFSVYLLATKAPLVPTAIATGVVAVVTKLLSRPKPGRGIIMPLWIPPLLALGLALGLAHDNPAPVAYVCGAMGALIGADLLNFPSFHKLGGTVLSIGGAGVFDGIFLVGMVAAILA